MKDKQSQAILRWSGRSGKVKFSNSTHDLYWSKSLFNCFKRRFFCVVTHFLFVVFLVVEWFRKCLIYSRVNRCNHANYCLVSSIKINTLSCVKDPMYYVLLQMLTKFVPGIQFAIWLGNLQLPCHTMVAISLVQVSWQNSSC